MLCSHGNGIACGSCADAAVSLALRDAQVAALIARYSALLGDLTDDEAARIVRVGRAVLEAPGVQAHGHARAYRDLAEAVAHLDEESCDWTAHLCDAIARAIEGKEGM